MSVNSRYCGSQQCRHRLDCHRCRRVQVCQRRGELDAQVLGRGWRRLAAAHGQRARAARATRSEIYIANDHANANGTLTASSGILKSIDGGDNWTNILPDQRGSQVRVTVSGDIYAGVSAQTGNPAVYLSTNGGTSFSPYSTNLQGSDIRSFGFAADDSALISLSLENGFYTNDAIPVPPTVPLEQTITEAPNVFQKLVFPPQTLGTTSAPKSVTIKNLGATAAAIAGFATDNQAFVVQGHTCGASLAAGASCTVSVVFAPNPPIAGETQGTLTVAGSVSGFSVGLWGTGASATLPFARLSLSPGGVPAYPEWFNMSTFYRELSFGNRAIGSSRTLSYTLTNFGGGLLNISPITVDNARFVLGGSCGATLAAGASCLVSFTYTPTAVGQDLGNVSITTDSTATIAGQLNFGLTGVGETAGATGSLLSTFGDAGRTYISTGPYGTETVLSLAHQLDGKTLALVVARKTVEDGVSVPAVVRLNVNGTLDNTFGTNGLVRLPPPGLFQFDTGSSIFAVANNKILVTLNVVNVAGTANDTYVYRLLPDGQIDAGFGTAGSTFVANLQHNVRIAPDGKIVLGGLDSTQPNNALIFTRLTVDGIVDTGFGTNGRTDVLLADAVQRRQCATWKSHRAESCTPIRTAPVRRGISPFSGSPRTGCQTPPGAQPVASMWPRPTARTICAPRALHEPRQDPAAFAYQARGLSHPAGIPAGARELRRLARRFVRHRRGR